MANLFEDVEVKEVEVKKEIKEKKEKKEIQKETTPQKKYKFPFGMYIDYEMVDISHVFEEDKEYSVDEIIKTMAEHQFYYFTGKVDFDYNEADNVLIPIFQQHKKG